MMLAPPGVSSGVALGYIGMGNLKVPNGFGGSGQSLQGSVKRPTVKFEAPRYAAFKAASLSHSSTTQDTEDVLPRDAGFADQQTDSAEVKGRSGLGGILHVLPGLAKCVLDRFLPNRSMQSIAIAVLVLTAIRHQVARSHQQAHHHDIPYPSLITVQEEVPVLEGRRRQRTQEQQLCDRPLRSLSAERSIARSRRFASQTQLPVPEEVTLSEASRGFLHKLRFLTLSVNGINRDSAKRDTLGYLMRMDKWDVVYLQETHHNGDGTTPSYAKLFKNCGYKGFWGWGSTIASGGVVIFISKRARRCGLKIPGGWQQGAETDGYASKGRLLCLPVTMFDTPYVLINLHIPCAGKAADRDVFMQAFKGALGRYTRIDSNFSSELVIGGDFNGVLDEFDILPRSGPNDVRIRHHAKVTNVLDPHQASDTWRHFMGNSPTFTHKYRTNHHGGSRLDTFALTPKATKLVIPSSMQHLLGYPGDHLGVSFTMLGRCRMHGHSDPCSSVNALSIAFRLSAVVDIGGKKWEQEAQTVLDAARDAKLAFEEDPQDATGKAFQEAQKKLQDVYSELAGMYMDAQHRCKRLALLVEPTTSVAV